MGRKKARVRLIEKSVSLNGGRDSSSFSRRRLMRTSSIKCPPSTTDNILTKLSKFRKDFRTKKGLSVCHKLKLNLWICKRKTKQLERPMLSKINRINIKYTQIN
jgi:hypothetical protein